MGVPSPPSSPRRAGAAHASTSSVSLGLVLAGVACLAAVAVGSFGLTTEATLGIDLGTTFSVAATCERGVVTVVRVPGGSGTHAQTMPSVVYFPERAREAAVVGADAARRRDTHPTRVVYDAKRLIGRRVDDPAVAEESKHLPFAVVADDGGFAAIQLGEADDHTPAGRRFAKTSSIAPEAVGAAILARLKAAAETAGDGGARSFAKRLLGFRFRTVTVSVPVNFSSEQKAATLRAARTAGFAVARLLEEPVAAAVAHDALRKERERETTAEKKKITERDDGGALVLVYDLGGGTLDVAVLRSEPSSGTFLVMGSAGDDRLGGEDFDRALLEWAREKLSSLPEPIFFPDALDGGRDERVRGDAPAAREEKDASKDDSNDASKDDSKDGFDRNASFLETDPDADARGVHERALRAMELAKKRLSDHETASIEIAYAFTQERNGVSSGDAAPTATRVVMDAKTAVREPSFETNDGSRTAIHSDALGHSVTLTLTRPDLETACAALLDRASAPVYAALRAAGGVGVAEITDVVLVGGSSRLAAVRARLAAIFGEERLARGRDAGPDPETAVAVGAARSYAC